MSQHDIDVAVPHRRYDGSGRQRDAAHRRSRMLSAARELFLEHGFGATSIDQIARRAEVSTQTVYAVFGNKAGVLRQVMDVAVGGDEQDVKLFDRPEFAAMFAAGDARDRVAMSARFAAAVHARTGELFRLVERAAGADPAVAQLAADLRQQQRDDAWRFVGSFESSALRAGLSREDAVEILLVLGSPSTWSSLVTDAGWALERYERWFADAMSRIVFALE